MRTLMSLLASALIVSNSFASEAKKISIVNGRVDEETVYTEAVGSFEDLNDKDAPRNKLSIENTVNFITLYDSTIEDEEKLKKLPIWQAVPYGFQRRVERDEMKLRRKLMNEDYPLEKFPFEAQLGDAVWDWAVANNFLGAKSANEYIEKAQEVTTISYTTEKYGKYKLRYQFDEFNKDHSGRIRLTATNLKYIDNLTAKIGVEDYELSTCKELPQFGDDSRIVLELGCYGETWSGEHCEEDYRFFVTFETPSLFFWKDSKDQEKYCENDNDKSTLVAKN